MDTLLEPATNGEPTKWIQACFYLYLHTQVSPESRHTRPTRRTRPEAALYPRAAPEVGRASRRIIDPLTAGYTSDLISYARVAPSGDARW